MSRISDGEDYYDSDFNNQYDFLDQAARLALWGKRGQKVLQELEAALLELPSKRLLASSFCTQGEVCALGALALKREQDAGKSLEEALKFLEELSRGYDSPPGESATDDEAVFFAQRQLKLTQSLAWRLIRLNDEDLQSATPEQRYQEVLRWVRSHIKPVPVVGV